MRSTHDEQIQLLTTPIQQFELWVEVLLKPPATTKTQTAAGVVGALGGVLSTPWTLPLSYDFGLLLADYMHTENEKARSAIAYSTAAFSGIGTAIMFGRMTHFVLQQLAASANKSQIPLLKNDFSCVNKILITALWIFAALSAVPSTYISCAEFIKPMGAWALFFILPSFGTLLARNGWGLANLFTLIFTSQLFMLMKEKTIDCLTVRTDEQKTIDRMRNHFIKELRDSSNIVAQLTQEEIARCISTIFGDSAEVTTLDKAKKLIHLQPQNRGLVPEQKSWGKAISGYLGSAVGAVSTWSFFPLGEDGSNKLMDYLGIHNQQVRGNSAVFFATSATIFVGALYIYTTLDTFEKFYQWFSKLPERVKQLFHRCNEVINGESSSEENVSPPINYRAYLKNGLAVLNAAVSFAGSGPLTMMTKENIDNESFYTPVVIACAFIGAFSTKLWIVDNLINEVIDGKSKAKKLLGAITKMIQLLPNLRDEHIKALYESLADNQGSINTVDHLTDGMRV